jgi:hypothetical protein
MEKWHQAWHGLACTLGGGVVGWVVGQGLAWAWCQPHPGVGVYSWEAVLEFKFFS